MTEKKNVEQKLELEKLLKNNGPVSLIIQASLAPIAEEDRFQPAGFPQIGHVIYNAPRINNGVETVCIVDSAASMANHLESVCLANEHDIELHPDLEGLPYVTCATGDDRKKVTSTFKEGHRIASDYFLDGLLEDKKFRDILREEFGIKEIQKDKKYFTYPENWWSIFSTIFKYDPNSLVHGVLFAKEQIKISRMLTAHLEAFGAKRVSSTGVKFDPLGKTTSGQPIFSVDEETANNIRATFIIDLALLRSYGRDNKGLNKDNKRLLLELSLWKIVHLLKQPFRFRSNCILQCNEITIKDEENTYASEFPFIDIQNSIKKCNPNQGEYLSETSVYYDEKKLFKAGDENKDNMNDGDESDETLS